MILDGKQDKAFLVLDKERFLFLLGLCLLFVLLSALFDDVFLRGNKGGVFLSSTGTDESLFQVRHRMHAVFADVHFGESIGCLDGNTLVSTPVSAKET
jgi:hypothetical protein